MLLILFDLTIGFLTNLAPGLKSEKYFNSKLNQNLTSQFPLKDFHTGLNRQKCWFRTSCTYNMKYRMLLKFKEQASKKAERDMPLITGYMSTVCHESGKKGIIQENCMKNESDTDGKLMI